MPLRDPPKPPVGFLDMGHVMAAIAMIVQPDLTHTAIFVAAKDITGHQLRLIYFLGQHPTAETVHLRDFSLSGSRTPETAVENGARKEPPEG
jgi:hypothetical protein